MSDWTERELATLAELAETFVRGDARRHARLVAEAIERAADPAQVRQFHRLLGLMESRWANLLLARRPTPFTSMSPHSRERYLLSWSTSPIASRRTAFNTLRRLMTFLAYADPGADASGNPRHAVIGYEPERPPVTGERTPIRPYALPIGGGAGDEAITLEADVVVVGSGAGGGVVAAELAEAGRSVVVLEAGPFVDEASMPRDELDAFSRLYLNHGLLATWDASLMMLAGSGVGGGTLVNWMTSIEAPASVRDEWAADHGIDQIADGEAWSDDIATLETELSITPAPRLPPKDLVIVNGAERLGWEAGPTRRNSTGCDDCGSCPFGCPRGAKQSGIRVHLARASVAGARIVPQVRVTRVLIERGRALGVEGRARLTGQRVRAGHPSARRPRAAGRARRRCAPLAGDPAGVGGPPPRDRRAPAGPSGPRGRGQDGHADRHVARPDAGSPIAPVHRRRQGPQRVRHRVGAGPSGPHRARVAVGRDRSARRDDA